MREKLLLLLLLLNSISLFAIKIDIVDNLIFEDVNFTSNNRVTRARGSLEITIPEEYIGHEIEFHLKKGILFNKNVSIPVEEIIFERDEIVLRRKKQLIKFTTMVDLNRLPLVEESQLEGEYRGKLEVVAKVFGGRRPSTLPEVGRPSTLPEVGRPSTLPEVGRPSTLPEVGRPSTLPEVGRPSTLPEVGRPSTLPEVGRPSTLPEVGRPSTLPEVERPSALPMVDIEFEVDMNLFVYLPLEIISKVFINGVVPDDEKVQFPFTLESNRVPERKDYYKLIYSTGKEFDLSGNGRIDTFINSPEYVNSNIITDTYIEVHGDKLGADGIYRKTIYITIEIDDISHTSL